MATWRRALEVAMSEEDVAHLTVVSRSRTEPASRVQRAQMHFWLIARAGLFCRWSTGWRAPSDGPTLHRAGAGLWAFDGA